jgi:hypothetical protein
MQAALGAVAGAPASPPHASTVPVPLSGIVLPVAPVNGVALAVMFQPVAGVRRSRTSSDVSPGVASYSVWAVATAVPDQVSEAGGTRLRVPVPSDAVPRKVHESPAATLGVQVCALADPGSATTAVPTATMPMAKTVALTFQLGRRRVVVTFLSWLRANIVISLTEAKRLFRVVRAHLSHLSRGHQYSQ